MCQKGNQTTGLYCSRSWIGVRSLLRCSRRHSPDRAVFCIPADRLLLLAHLQFFFPFATLKWGAKLHVGPRCLHCEKDHSLEARVIAGAFKWMKVSLSTSAHKKVQTLVPIHNWFWNKGRDETYPALMETWWVRPVSAVLLTALWVNNWIQTRCLRGVMTEWSRP